MSGENSGGQSVSQIQQLIEEPPDERTDWSWVVLTNYDDPHPHVEGVFEEEQPARELMDDCRATAKSPHPLAWTLVKIAGDEFEVVDP